MAQARGYLLKPPRTLRQACREIRATHPEWITADCDACPHRGLCAISERIERDRRRHVAKNENQSALARSPPIASERPAPTASGKRKGAPAP